MTSATNLVSLTRPSLEIFNKFQTGVFLILGTTHDIDMKLGPVTERDKGNTATSNKFDDEFMPVNCDVIVVVFSIYGQFAAIWKPDPGRMVYKTYIFINSNLLSYKTRKTELLPRHLKTNP